MKKTLIFLFVIVLVFSLAGCGAKKNLEEKAAAALAEKILGDAIGGDIKIDGDIIKIQGPDGEELIMGGTEWPKTDLVKNIPEFQAGIIVSVMVMKDSALISLDKVKKEDFVKYLEEIKKNYTEEAYDFNADGSLTYGAGNGKGIGIMLMYTSDGTLSIAVSQVTD